MPTGQDRLHLANVDVMHRGRLTVHELRTPGSVRKCFEPLQHRSLTIDPFRPSAVTTPPMPGTPLTVSAATLEDRWLLGFEPRNPPKAYAFERVCVRDDWERVHR